MTNTNTKIEWTDATWNPVTGCSKVSQGCKNCYAERVFQRAYPGRRFTDVRTHPDRLDQPLRWKKPRRIFVNSMSDLFHEDMPTDFIVRIWQVMRDCEGRHTFQVLTKRPARMRNFIIGCRRHHGVYGANGIGWPLPNVWLGVSVENQETADERIPLLLQTPAAVRFVSYEPALGPANFTRWLWRCECGEMPTIDARWRTTGASWQHHHGYPVRHVPCLPANILNWIIAGGESGPHARPAHPEWFRSVRDQCQAAGVPFFFKQWGEWGPNGGEVRNIGTDIIHWEDWPPLRRVGKKRAGRLLDGREWNEFPVA